MKKSTCVLYYSMEINILTIFFVSRKIDKTIKRLRKISYLIVLWHENKFLNFFFVPWKIDKIINICFYNGQEN
jgi:hypothetical protein